MKFIAKITFFVVMSALAWMPALAQEPVAGSVKIAEGKSEIVRQSQAQPAVQGARLYQSDVLRTGGDGKLGVVLKDDTLISLGPDTELVLDEFVFVPVEDRMSLTTKMIRGTAVFLSGTIGKLAPEKVKVDTPSASIGIRGTKFAVQVQP
jgi:hypothetical protein